MVGTTQLILSTGTFLPARSSKDASSSKKHKINTEEQSMGLSAASYSSLSLPGNQRRLENDVQVVNLKK